MPWMLKELEDNMDKKFLTKFETRDLLNALLGLRHRIDQLYDDEILSMVKGRDK
jgi:hypothetical protein